MPNDFLSADQQRFTKAYKEYVDKINSAWEALATHGLDSPQFAEADKRAVEAQKALSATQGNKGAYWRG